MVQIPSTDSIHVSNWICIHIVWLVRTQENPLPPRQPTSTIQLEDTSPQQRRDGVAPEHAEKEDGHPRGQLVPGIPR